MQLVNASVDLVFELLHGLAFKVVLAMAPPYIGEKKLVD